MTVDAATKNFTIRKVGAQPEPGKSFELWLISDKLPSRARWRDWKCRFHRAAGAVGLRTDFVNNATYAVTIEQAGGSPNGNLHSAPVYTGKLVEAVPPAAPAAAKGR